MKVAAIQIESKLDYKKNLETIRSFLSEAKKNKVTTCFLPECFYSMSDGAKATPYLVIPKDGNEHFENIRSLARDFGVFLIGGSAATLVNDKILNRNFNFDPNGKELTFYDKIHLFSCDLSRDPSKQILNEGKIYSSGSEKKMIEIDNFKIGLGICFDLRFPEMWRSYFKNGANLLTISSAFTVPTGKAHWHTLVRARAIENQSFVVATGQWGVHNEKIKTFGHSLIIDPWGEILADAGEGEKIIYADLNLEKVNEVRSRLNVPTDF